MTVQLTAMTDDAVVKLDLTKHQADEKVNIKKLGPDLYEWSLPDGRTQTAMFELKTLGVNDLNQYDELRFDIKPEGSQVALATRIYGFPTKKDVTSWYLKFKTQTGKWAEGRYDLRLDDDGIFLRRGKLPDDTLVMTLARRILGIPGEPSWRKALIRNPRLVKYRIHVSVDWADCEIVDEPGQIVYQYKVKLENRTGKSQSVTIDPDSSSRLKYFTVSAPKTVDLKAKETKTVVISMTISRMQALALPPLYSERIYPKIAIDGVEDSDVIPLMGFRRWPLWGVVPIFNRITWTPATMQAFLDARQKAIPKIADWKTFVIRDAEKAMKYDWPIPKDILPGHTMGYRITKSKVYPKPVKPTEFHRHVDPKTGKIYENDERLDRAYVGRYYGSLSNYVHDCSLAYLITGEEKYAKKAIKILADLADAHPEMPVAGRRSTSGGSTLACNTLLSSYVLPKLAEGFSLLSAAPCLDEKMRKKIKTFLVTEALSIARHSTEYSNQTAEHIRAYGSVGIATGFWPVAGEAIYGEFGWHEMVEYAYSEEGITHEAGAYHRAIFGAMDQFADFALGQNVNLYTARFKRVFDGSLIAGMEGVSYETAYNVYRDPAYLKRLADERKRRCRGQLVFHGILGIPEVTTMKVASALMPSTGYVFLRKGNMADNTEIRLNYIKTFDRSEHDKFTTFLYKNGVEVDSTVGRIIYSSPHAHWMYETAAHNTIVINGENEANVDGELLAHDFNPDHPVAVVKTVKGNTFYQGVDQLRCIVLIEDAYIVFDSVQANAPCIIDRYQHGLGNKATFKPKAKATDKAPTALPSHAPFSDFQVTPPLKALQVSFENGLKMKLISDQDFQAYKAVSVGGWQAYPREVTFARLANARKAVFLAGFVFGEEAVLPEMKILNADQGSMSFEVKTAKKVYKVTIDVAKKSVIVE